ncbi:hypothetical protein ACF0H5_009393 [Mactra antiquata]
MRVYGLKLDNYSEESLEEIMLNKVLKVAAPSRDWSTDDIMSVRVIRNGRDNRLTPLIIIKFRFLDDKFKVYSGRDILRHTGVRVGDDLTFKQRQRLKSAQMTGKKGYFYYYKGELKFRPESNSTAEENQNNGGRMMVKARRKMNNSDHHCHVLNHDHEASNFRQNDEETEPIDVDATNID